MRKNAVAVVGAAETTELGVIPNVSQIQLHADAALNAIAEAFPKRAVIGIHAVDLVWGLGTLHCLTQQQPAKPSGK